MKFKKTLLLLAALASTLFLSAEHNWQDDMYSGNSIFSITNIFDHAIARLSNGKLYAVLDRDLDVGDGTLLDIVFDGGDSFMTWREEDQVVMSNNDSDSLEYSDILGRLGLYNITQDKYEDVYMLPVKGESKVKDIKFEEADYKIILDDETRITVIDDMEIFRTGELEEMMSMINVDVGDTIVYCDFTLKSFSEEGDSVIYSLYFNIDSNQIIEMGVDR